MKLLRMRYGIIFNKFSRLYSDCLTQLENAVSMFCDRNEELRTMESSWSKRVAQLHKRLETMMEEIECHEAKELEKRDLIQQVRRSPS